MQGMIKENSFSFEYVNVPADSISRGTVFVRGADIEQSRVSDIPSRNYKTNSFQNRWAEFRTEVNLKTFQNVHSPISHSPTEDSILWNAVPYSIIAYLSSRFECPSLRDSSCKTGLPWLLTIMSLVHGGRRVILFPVAAYFWRIPRFPWIHFFFRRRRRTTKCSSMCRSSIDPTASTFISLLCSSCCFTATPFLPDIPPNPWPPLCHSFLRRYPLRPTLLLGRPSNSLDGPLSLLFKVSIIARYMVCSKYD